MIKLSEEDVLPLYLLEGILYEEYSNLPEALTKLNDNLHRFRIRNL